MEEKRGTNSRKKYVLSPKFFLTMVFQQERVNFAKNFTANITIFFSKFMYNRERKEEDVM